MLPKKTYDAASAELNSFHKICCVMMSENKRPSGNWTAFLSRENSSNGGSKTIRTFWEKSYGPLKVSVKEFFQNKCLCFQ